jgi:protocatechuate 3,4-dioxygenase beta subunit
MLRKVTPLTAVLIAASLMLCLVFVLSSSQQISAQAAPAVPDAPGSISGIVTNELGEPLAGIEVQLFFSNPDFASPLRTLTTDSNGFYRATVLPTGAYQIRYRDLSGLYAQTFYPNALTLESAAPVAVAGNDVAGVNVVLGRAGVIEGRLSRTGNGYIGYSEVAALVQLAGQWQRAASVWIEAAGVYSLTGLQPGVYAVCAFNQYAAAGGGPSVNEASVCYDDIVSSIDNSHPVTVTQGMTTTGIDLTLGVTGDSAAIGGIVRSSAGAALPDVVVMLYRRDIIGSYSTMAMTTTNAAGEYSFRGLRRGTYTLFFRDTVGPNLAAYLGGVSDPGMATPITVDRFEQHLDVDVTLGLGGLVSGRITVLGDTPPEWAFVSLQNVNIPWSYYYSFFPTYDRSTGAYRVPGVPPGIYRVAVEARLNGMSFSGYYGHTGWVDPELITTITVTQGAHLDNINVDLGQGVFDGAISGRVLAGGTALAGARVSLYPANNTLRPIVEIAADAEGSYRFGGLTDGGYVVGFSDPLGRYATSFYSNTVAPSLATRLGISYGAQMTDVNAALQPGGVLMGRILLNNNAPANGYGVQVWYVNDSLYSPLAMMTQRSVTDAAGIYRIAGLPPGEYRVCAGPLFRGEWFTIGCYGGPPQYGDPMRASNVRVQAEATTQDVDIFLGDAFPEQAFLPVIDR